MSKLIKNGEIVLYGTVGLEWWGEWFSASDVMTALYSFDPNDPVVVRINSGGGNIQDGIAIANMLMAHPGEVTCIVDSVAASAASVIAIAGDVNIMRPGTLLMIHDPSACVWGNVDDLTIAADMLETYAQAMASIYAAKTGQSVAEARAAMKTETWYTAESAVAAKLCDQVGQPLTGSGGVMPLGDEADPDQDGDEDESEGVDIDIDITIATPEAAAFDYRIYASAPKVLADLAAARNWTAKPPKARKSRPLKPSPTAKAPTMSNPNPTNTPSAAVTTTTTSPSASVAAEIAQLCLSEGVPVMASALIREGVTLDQAKTRVAGAKDIRAAVELSRRNCPQIEASLADKYIAAGTSIESVRADLFKVMTDVQAVSQVSNAHQPGPLGGGHRSSAQIDVGAVYAAFNKSAGR